MAGLDSPMEVAQQMREEHARQTASEAQVAYTEATEDSSITPEFAAEQLKAARAGQGGNVTEEQVKRNKIAAEYDWREDPDEVGAYHARIARDMRAARLLKGDIRTVSTFERAAHWLAGEDGEARDLGKSARNSLARGLYSLQNLFGNTPALRSAAERLTWLRDAQKAIDEGREAEFFGTSADPTGAIGAASFRMNGAAETAEVEQRIRELSTAQARSIQIQGLYPQSQEMQRFGQVKGFGEAFSFILQNPLEFMANAGPEMAIQMAPAIGAAAVGSAISPFATLGLMATQGAFSYSIDKNAGMVEGMAEAGINTTDPEAVAQFFMNSRDPLYRKIDEESTAHAGPVAAFDAMSVIAAMARLPMKMGARVHDVAPGLARGYEGMMAAPMMHHGANLVAQSAVQSAMGAGGEAAGQIAARGEIYSPADVVAEIAGEHFLTPLEMVNAARAARADGIILAARNDKMHEVLTMVHEAAQQSTSLPLDPETHREIVQEGVDIGTTPNGEALWQSIPFSPDMLDDATKQALSQASPAFAEALAKAERDGSAAEVSYADFVTQIAPNEAAPQFIAATHVPLEMSNGEIEMLAQNQVDEVTRTLADTEQATFRASLKTVSKSIEQMLESVPETSPDGHGAMTRGEKRAAVSLITAHVSAMARDAGLTPEEVWKQFGLAGIGSERGGTIDLSRLTAQAGALAQRAYNGSPNIFDRFSTEHIGEGQGAQAHGWGLYFASSKKVAEWYRRTYSTSDSNGYNYKFEDGTSAASLWSIIDDLAEKTGKESFSREEIVSHLEEKRDFWARQLELKRENGQKEAESAYRAELAGIEEQLTGVNERIAELEESIESADAEEVEDLQNELDGLYGERDEISDLREEAEDTYKQSLEEAQDTEYEEDQISGIEESIARVGQGVERVRAGRTYQVEIPDTEDMLDEDLEIKEQPAKVRKICEQIAQELGITVTDTMIGEDFYKALMERLGSPKAASMMLNERGIPGIHYIGADDGECFVIFDDAAIEINAVFQGAADRALGAYLPGARQILLSAQSNKSTFLHETGHWFLDARVRIALELKQQADLTDAQKRFLDLTEKTIAWLMPGKTLEEFAAMPLEKDGGPRRAAEEKFARTYEAYLYEGKAPTEKLRSLFNRFSAWLRTVYAAITSIPEAEMSDDVRELFDGLFVASEQAREAILRRGIYRATADYLAGNVSDTAIVDALKRAYADLEDSVRETLMERYFRDAKHIASLREKKIDKLTKQGKEILKRLKDEARARLEKEKDQAAYAALTRGMEVGRRKGIKLRILSDKHQDVGGVDLYVTVDELLANEDKGYRDTDGQTLAEKLGYTSEDEMVKALEARQDIDALADREANERFMNEFGEFSSHERIVEAADQALYASVTETVLSRELKLMDKAVGNKPATKALFIPVVDAIIGRIPFKDLNPRAYRADATRAANKAFAFLTGKKKGANGEAIQHDTIAAAREKRRQMFHSLKAERAQKIRDEIAKRIRNLRSFASAGKPEAKGVDTEYFEMVQSLLALYGIAKDPNHPVRQTFEEFAKAQIDKGIPMPDMPPPKANFTELTVNEALAVLKGIKQIADVGRELEALRVASEKIKVKEAQEVCAQAIINNAINRGIDPILEQRGEGQQSKGQSIVRNFFMSHRRIPSLLQCMEGTQFGKLWEYIVRPFDAAGAREETMRAELSRKAAEILKPLRPLTRSNRRRIFRPYLDGSFTDAEIVAIALNMNSEENLARLIAGSERYKGRSGRGQWTEENIIKEVQSVLNKEQLEAIQRFWDLCGSLWPDVVALEHETHHRSPIPVQPKETTFTLPSGEQVTLKGGYYPIRYDKNVSNSAVGIDADHEDALSTMTARSLAPDRTHSMARAAGVPPGRAVELTLTAGFSGLDSVVHDLCWRKELANAARLFDPQGELTRAIKEYWGVEAWEAIDRWRKDIATGDNRDGNQLDVMANVLRSNVSLAGIGFNLVTAAVQFTGFAQSVAALGPRWAGVGISEFIKNPKAMHELCQRKSQVMASRARTQFRELAEAHSMMSGTTGPVREKIMRYAYMPIVLVQTAVDVPTWLGAYNHALADGCSEAEAVARADRVLIDTQGSGRLQDLSGVERGGPWQKFFTVFYTFFNTTYNLALVKGQTETGMKRALNLLTLLAVQPVLEGFLREALKIGGDDDDDDDLKLLKNAGKSVVSFNMGLLMGARELASAVDGFNYRGPSGLRKLNDLDKLATQVKQGEFDEGLLKAMVSVTGDWVGIPVVPINRAISGVNALANDETDNWLAPFLGYSKY